MTFINNERIARIEAPLYQYRSRAGSIVHHNKIGKIDVDRLDVGLQIVEFISKSHPELLELAKAELLTESATRQVRLWQYGSDPEYSTILLATIQKCIEAVRPNFHMFLNKDIPFRRKSLCLGAIVSFKATCRLKQMALMIINR